MFYYVSKSLFFFLMPSTLALGLVASGTVLMMRRPGKGLGPRLAIAGLVLLVVGGFSPLGHMLMLPLEQRFTRPELDNTQIAGIVVLGGFEEGRIGNARGNLELNEAGDRLSEVVRLAHLLPAASIIFTGGAAGVLLAQEDAAEAVARYLRELKLAPSRIVTENKSRTTWENAVFTRTLVEPKPGERFLLVTSAWHMPRAVGAFRQAGWNDLIAWPVDYRTSGAGDLLRPFESMPEGLERLDRATREWAGLLGYYASGRSDSLWPGPR